jgi:hypothetical protein
VGNVVTIADGRRLGRDTLNHILCVLNAKEREDLSRQPLSITSPHIVVTQYSFGMKITGRGFASSVMIKRQ